MVLRKQLFDGALAGVCTVVILVCPLRSALAEDSDVLDRISSTLKVSIDLSPSLAVMQASVDVHSAETMALAAAGTPYVEIQQEGVGSAFDWAPNAQTTLRLGTSFNLPSHSHARREVRDATET